MEIALAMLMHNRIVMKNHFIIETVCRAVRHNNAIRLQEQPLPSAKFFVHYICLSRVALQQCPLENQHSLNGYLP